MKIIDVWCNIFTPEGMKKYYSDPPEMKEVGERLKTGSRRKGYEVLDFCKLLDESQVEKVIIPALKIKSFMKQVMLKDMTIEEIYGILKQTPERFKGMMGINPFLRMEGVKELEKAVKEYGFVGAHIHPYGFGIPVNDAMYYPFFAKCNELDVPVMIQIGHSAEFMPNAMGRPILLDDIALYFPGLKIIAAHTGWPWVEELIALAWKHPNVYGDISAYMPKSLEPYQITFMFSGRGKNKVMWGTNGIGLARGKKELMEMDAKDDVKAKILRENAMGFLGLDR